MASLTSILERVIHQPLTKAAYDAIKTTLEGGWVGLVGAFAWASTDGPTFVMTPPVDLTSIISKGARIRIVQGGVTKYFIVTAIAAGSITLYGGTTYTLLNAAITSVDYSTVRAPVGFPTDPVLWSEVFSSASDVVQNAPTNGVWYNPGSQSLVLPIGAWILGYMANMYTQWTGGASNIDVYSTLSTANNSESDAEFTSGFNGYGTAGAVPGPPAMRSKPVTVTVKTSYFLNIKNQLGVTNIGFRGSYGKTVMRAVCAYL